MVTTGSDIVSGLGFPSVLPKQQERCFEMALKKQTFEI